MARVSLSQLIAAVRLLIDDPNPVPGTSTPVFSDDAVQDTLDHHRQDVNYLELAPKQTIATGGGVRFLDYYAMQGSSAIGDWEADAVLQGYPSFGTLAPVTSDYIVGHWTFDTSLDPTGQRPPVYIVGKTFDRFMAAAELLEQWAARMSRNYDFSADGSRFAYSQQRAGLLQMAREYKMRARPRMLQMVRTDLPHGLWQRGRFDMNRTTF